MTAKMKKKELFTDKDRAGLAEKQGIEMGSLLSNEDKQNGLGLHKGEGLFTKKDKEGLF
jgi:hypothetical protein